MSPKFLRRFLISKEMRKVVERALVVHFPWGLTQNVTLEDGSLAYELLTKFCFSCSVTPAARIVGVPWSGAAKLRTM